MMVEVDQGDQFRMEEVPEQPYIKITVMKSNADNDISNVDEYFITKEGLSASDKYNNPTPVGQSINNVPINHNESE